MIPLFLPPIMKACPLDESYVLTDDIFCHPISYVMVSLTLLLLFPCLIDTTRQHMTDFCVLVFPLFQSEDFSQS